MVRLLVEQMRDLVSGNPGHSPSDGARIVRRAQVPYQGSSKDPEAGLDAIASPSRQSKNPRQVVGRLTTDRELQTRRIGGTGPEFKACASPADHG